MQSGPRGFLRQVAVFEILLCLTVSLIGFVALANNTGPIGGPSASHTVEQP